LPDGKRTGGVAGIAGLLEEMAAWWELPGCWKKNGGLVAGISGCLRL